MTFDPRPYFHVWPWPGQARMSVLEQLSRSPDSVEVVLEQRQPCVARVVFSWSDRQVTVHGEEAVAELAAVN